MIRPHPGAMLQTHLNQRSISQRALADAIHVTGPTINQLCLGRRRISPRMAFRLGRVLGTSAQFWLKAQMDYDLEKVLTDSEFAKELVTIDPK